MVYSILTETRIKASSSDLKPAERSYSTFWTRNGNLEGWDSILDLDIVGVWNGFIFGTKTAPTTGSIGPSSTFTPVDARVNDRIFFRLKYDKHPKNSNITTLGKIQFITTANPLFDDVRSVTFDIFPDGKWHLYEINMAEVETWVGEVNNIKFFPCINGARNDEFFLNFFEIGTNTFSFSLDNARAGIAGKVTSSLPLNGPITITQGFNDKLIVNIDGYGDVQITLTPQTVAPALIVRDISLQLGKVGIGGYIRAEAFIEDDTQNISIESGIRAANSSVTIKDGPQTSGKILNFLDAVGFFIGTSTAGTDPAADYVPLSSYRPTTLEILALFDNDAVLPAFTLDPQAFVIEGGNRNYALTTRQLTTTVVVEGRDTDFDSQKIQTTGTFVGQAKTFIDINHPFIDDGRVDKIFMNGVADTTGLSKWKIFRPNLNGTLSLVVEGVIGKTPTLDSQQVLTVEPGVYVEDVSNSNVQVRRGDLLGIFNVDLHTGGYGAKKVDALYYDIAGDTAGTITPPPPSGAGEQGIPIYATGSETKNRAVIDIDFKKRLNLDTLQVFGFEDQRDLEYNVSTATSASFGADINGNHTICFAPPPFITRTCFDRTNTIFNLQALNDDVIFAENGIAGFGDGGSGGLGGATVAGATYFYVNGDGEFLNVQEFTGPDGADAERFEFTRDPLGIDCFFSSTTPRLDKPIGRVVIYFKDKKNQRSWQIETATNGGGNGSKQGFQLVPEDSLTAVEIDTNRISKVRGFITKKTDSSTADLLLRNPAVLDVIAADGTRNPQKGVDFVKNVGELGGVNIKDQTTFLNFQWTKFAWEFESIRTAGFRWFTDFHLSTKISEFQIFAVSSSQESMGDNTQVLFSSDGDSFFSADLLSSDTENADYKIGGSPQFMRLVFRPTLQLAISDIKVNFENDQICFGEEGRLVGAVAVEDSRVGSIGNPTEISVTNSTGQTADLIVDIPSDINSTQQLLYFSKLNSAQDIITPQVGPPGRVDFTSDKILQEEDNIAINARCWGLVNLVSGTGSKFITDNLLIDPGFESGNLNNWQLNVLQSGTERFQVPRVMDIATENSIDEDPGAAFQTDDFVFGYSIDAVVPEHESDFVPMEFQLSQSLDISDFSLEIDTGNSFASVDFRYISMHAVGPVSTVSILGAPTLSGVLAISGTVVDSAYGTNLLRSFDLERAVSIVESSADATISLSNIRARLKENTRFVRLLLHVDHSAPFVIFPDSKQKFLSDDFSLKLELPAITNAKWYKSWRTGVIPTISGEVFNGWTDANFVPVTDFIDTTGSTHWWQPFDSTNTTSNPNSGTKVQTQGFSNVFLNDRFKGVSSFRRMDGADAGYLGTQWSGEKNIIGLRIAMNHNASNNPVAAQTYPRSLNLEVLKTRTELGGITPDINNPAHLKLVSSWIQLEPLGAPSASLQGTISNSDAPWSQIITLLFESAPVSTEGMRIVFTRNCDRLERAVHPTNTAFAAFTTCPSVNDVFDDWSSDHGLAVSVFTPLESVGNVDLPIDNIREQHLANSVSPNTGPVFAAVDLGRHHAIDTDSDLFELIAESPNQSFWGVGSVIFSPSDTADPNQVVWSGNSSNARWIRFESGSSAAFEDGKDLVVSTKTTEADVFVKEIPQGTINQARIYPDIAHTPVLFPVEGYNSTWRDLGTILSDNRNSTFIYYSDFPVIAMDLGKGYIIANDTDVLRKRHDLVAGVPAAGIDSTDRVHWNPNSEDNFTYALTGGEGTDRPETVSFRQFGAGVPDTAVRWAAFKGTQPLLADTGGSTPKAYNFQTQGQILFNTTFKPRIAQVLTENAQWFTNEKSALSDISTFVFKLGTQLTVQDGVDYGSASGPAETSTLTNGNNIGDPYLAFDGKFDELGAESDVWGVAVRDIITGLNNPDDAFPHSIWRVFRDIPSDTVLEQEVKAILIRGANERFYPTDFQIQRLRENDDGSIKDPNLDASWQTIGDASFTGINTFQEGIGFTHIFPITINTKGIRIRITDSVFPDDSVESQTEPNTGTVNSTFPQTSGPQTRVSNIIIYKEIFEQSPVIGAVDTDHMVSASVSSSTATPDHEIEKINDGDISSFWQSTGFSDIINIQLLGPRAISRMEWRQDPNLGGNSAQASTNAPSDFILKGVVDGQSQTLVTGSSFLGTTFSGTLAGAPVTAENFTLEITSVQGQQEDANSIIISELKLIESQEISTPLTTVESIIERRPGGINNFVTQITYSPDSDAVAKITADGIDANNDAEFSGRDFFSLWVFINDISLLDVNFGNIKLGNNLDTHYRWDLKNMNLQSGWQQLKLQFRTADSTSAIEFEPGLQFNSNIGRSQVDFITADVVVTSSVAGVFKERVLQAPGIRFFEIEFRGNRSNSPLIIKLDDFRFVRNRFDDVCKFAPSLYLNNSELFTIFLNGLDIATGTVEFWFQPDWDSGGRLEADRPIIPSLFKIVRPDGKFLSLFYRPNTGFVAMVFDGNELFQFVTNVSGYRFEEFETFHVALVWDAARRVTSSKASLALYINAEPVYGTDQQWEAVREGGASIAFGGEVSQRFATTPDNSTALTFTPVPTQPASNTASTWGLIENIKIYNYPKSNFNDINSKNIDRTQTITPSEMIQVSLDGVTFVGAGSESLPLEQKNIADGDITTIFVRTNIPRNLTGDEKRDATLLVRWRADLETCD